METQLVIGVVLFITFLAILVFVIYDLQNQTTKDDGNKLSAAVEKTLKKRGYKKEEDEFAAMIYDENWMDGHANLYHYSKTFGGKYKIRFGTDGKAATWPCTDVTWTIWYADGSKEWGYQMDTNFQPDPNIGIGLIENHAEIAYTEKMKKASLFG